MVESVEKLHSDLCWIVERAAFKNLEKFFKRCNEDGYDIKSFINKKNGKGRTVLFDVVGKTFDDKRTCGDYLKIAELLLKNDADPTVACFSGYEGKDSIDSLAYFKLRYYGGLAAPFNFARKELYNLLKRENPSADKKWKLIKYDNGNKGVESIESDNRVGSSYSESIVKTFNLNAKTVDVKLRVSHLPINGPSTYIEKFNEVTVSSEVNEAILMHKELTSSQAKAENRWYF